MSKKLSVIGLGKLGATMSACFIHKGFEVIGVDKNQDFVDTINNGKSPIYEPHVDSLISANKERIQATTEIEFAVLHSDVSFIIVPTPSMPNGLFSTKYVEAVIADMAEALKVKKTYHLIVITSTVLPGDTARMAADLERLSGKKLNEDFGVVYNPDFIALGKIVHDFLHPDMILIGESDDRAGALIEQIHLDLVDNDPGIFRMNWYNAELSKISLNAFCTLKITYANSIAEICENMPGGDAAVVLKAIGSDTRVGNKYFKGGLGFGGPCFPRDNRALSKCAEKLEVSNLFCGLTDEINDYHKTDRISNMLIKFMKEKDATDIAVLGLSYKDDTPVIEESVAIEVIRTLTKFGVDVTVYDPAAMDNTAKEFEGNEFITYETSALACMQNKSICFVATPWKEFGGLKAEQVSDVMVNPIILDAWGILPFTEESGLDVRRIGKNYK